MMILYITNLAHVFPYYITNEPFEDVPGYIKNPLLLQFFQDQS